MNLVIPTYNRHYEYNINFLKSFDKFCLDKNDVKINFIVSSNDYNNFIGLKNQFTNLNINFFKLNDLLMSVDQKRFSDNLSFFAQKYPLQSIKKLFAYKCVDTDYIVIDSENLCLKEFKFSDIFYTLKNKPILYCNNIYQNIQKDVNQSCNDLLNYTNNKWFFVKSYWFYELEYVEKLLQELKDLHKNDVTLILKDKLFFDYQLYSTYLFKHNNKKFLCIDEILKKDYNFQKQLDELGGNYEYMMTILNEENYLNYTKILNDLDERIIRLHWIDENIKNKIINNTNVSIGTFHWD
jgi:hypothetical protein